MGLRIENSSAWRGRAQLYGTKRGDKIEYVNGPRVGMWAWDSSQNAVLQNLEANVYDASVKAADRLRAKKDELVASGRFTPAGIRDELRQFAETSVKPALDRARAELDSAQQHVRERRAGIKPIAATSDDAVTTLKKMEARTILRGMSRRDLVNVLAGPNPDPVFVQAALESPPYMVSNIDSLLRKHLEQLATQSQFGPQIEELDDIEGAINDARKAASVVAAEVTKELQPAPQLVSSAGDKKIA
ncbi:hypothetical protein [Bradyrhizobium australafricanum]|uniref:hypothetical protein n=1 Tax=Bradyrhizobium australafricanum TaxID=2821406 RepID=UPI001CE37CBB|nr:hypothetical protein [Bradyrhizobium australafricanum]MCA6102356.1 hypothetical protein [Bradyrhizobium australafricanum]